MADGRNRNRTVRAWEKHNNKKKPYNYHIHHIDGNKLNDCPNNLICVTREEHAKIHLDMYKKDGNPKDAYAYNRLVLGDKLKGFKLSEEHKNKLRGKRKGGWTLSFEDRKKMSERMKGVPMKLETKEKLGKSIICYKIKTGEEFVFYSQREAGRRLSLCYKSINRVLRGLRKTHKGYSFKYN